MTKALRWKRRLPDQEPEVDHLETITALEHTVAEHENTIVDLKNELGALYVREEAAVRRIEAAIAAFNSHGGITEKFEAAKAALHS